jgi:hypothetical protein
MRLIDADELIERLLESRREETETTLKLERFIKKQPTIEPKPKRGRWEVVDYEEPRRYGCSECKRLVWHTENYCPCCGAKMESE